MLVLGVRRNEEGDDDVAVKRYAPFAAKFIALAVGVCARWETPRKAAHEIVGSLDLDATMAGGPDNDLVTGSQARLAQDRPASRRMRTGIMTGAAPME